ncbi:MAG TPA: alpha/beta fold hydrolase [Pseudobacteroides sp.]|uniref:alpha/beta hydrolase n=1 Tax=Pseudobacteroides sp. TaxID=1968840 RepID=UPI002F95BE29
MNKAFSYIIDCISLELLHRERSSKSHFSTDSNVDIADFYKKPSIPIITLNPTDKPAIYSYTFKSEIDNNKCNELVHGLYYKSPTQPASKSIILVPGWRMKDYSAISDIFLEGFLKKGYDVYFISLPFHNPRAGSDSEYCGELMISTDIGRTLLSVKQAVSDIRALICYLKSINQKVVLAGISLGGFITNLTATAEENIDALISAFYANSMSYSTWHTIPGRYLKRDFVANSYDYELLKEKWDIFNPSLRMPLIPKENILLFSGLYDKYVHIEDTDRLWKAWNNPKRVLYKIGHSGLIIYKKKILHESLLFIKEKNL